MVVPDLSDQCRRSDVPNSGYRRQDLEKSHLPGNTRVYPFHERLDLGVQLLDEGQIALRPDDRQFWKGCLQVALDLFTALPGAGRERCKDLLDGFPIHDMVRMSISLLPKVSEKTVDSRNRQESRMWCTWFLRSVRFSIRNFRNRINERRPRVSGSGIQRQK